MPDDAPDATPDRASTPVPEPLAPAEGTEIEDPSVTFEWTAVSGASTYELQLAEDRAFEQIVFEGRVGDQTAFTYSGLPPQEGVSLHWRVRAAVGGDFGDYGPTASFVVVDWQPAQPGAPTTTAEVEAGSADSSDFGSMIAAVLVTVVALAVGLAYSLGDTTITQSSSTARSVPPPDTASLDDYRVRDDGTVVIPIDSAMKKVVEGYE